MKTGTVKYFTAAGFGEQKRSRLEERGVEIIPQSEIFDERISYQKAARAQLQALGHKAQRHC